METQSRPTSSIYSALEEDDDKLIKDKEFDEDIQISKKLLQKEKELLEKNKAINEKTNTKLSEAENYLKSIDVDNSIASDKPKEKKPALPIKKKVNPNGIKGSKGIMVIKAESLESKIKEHIEMEESEFGMEKGLLSEASLRYMKVKIEIMTAEIEKMTIELNQKEFTIKDLTKQVDDKKEAMKQMQKVNGQSETLVKKLIQENEQFKTSKEETQSKYESIRKEYEKLKSEIKSTEMNMTQKDVKYNRLLEEIEKLKNENKRLLSENRDAIALQKSIEEGYKTENKKLEKQKNELLNGFKKQMQLIQIMKKQKIHIEASKWLSITENEYLKQLEWIAKE